MADTWTWLVSRAHGDTQSVCLERDGEQAAERFRERMEGAGRRVEIIQRPRGVHWDGEGPAHE